MNNFSKILLVIFVFFCLSACSNAKVKEYTVKVVKEYPHDETSFTEGMFFHDGNLYESTGMEGESTFRMVDLQSGKALKRLNFNQKYFVEGSIILGNKLYILTWQNQIAFVYNADNLTYQQSYSYPREGWGLTTDGKYLIASDGTANIYFMDDKFNTVKTITVKKDGRPMIDLNELEYIDGKIWANVYTTDMILIINPKSGNVEGVIDCTGLLPSSLRDSKTDVLNGIAYNPITKKIYLTGKYWKRLYEIKLVSKEK